MPPSRIPPKHRPDGTSPLPLGMDWSPPLKQWGATPPPNPSSPSHYRRLLPLLVPSCGPLCSCSPESPRRCLPTAASTLDHKGISNAAPADCPLLPLPIPNVGNTLALENEGSCEARIHDYINNLRFSISPTAFFQVNTLAAEKLYSLAGDWANLSSDALLFDVCCGTGTIGLTLAHRVGMVVGIEMNNSAVSDAQRNAEIN